jgi:type IV fimbrial biogenesis protein FimT
MSCGGNWADGVLVFVDEDNDREVDSGKQALRYFDFEAGRGRIYWRSFGNRQYLQMTPLGFTKNQNGTFTYCPESGDLSQSWMLILNRPGRARIAVDRDGDGLVEDSRGRPARC